jgi:hypothetical protein
MASLDNAQRTVLQTIFNSPKDAAGNMSDDLIARATRFEIDYVRDCLEALETEELVAVARTTDGYSVSITAKGRLAVKKYRPFSSNPHGGVTTLPTTVDLPSENAHAPPSLSDGRQLDASDAEQSESSKLDSVTHRAVHTVARKNAASISAEQLSKSSSSRLKPIGIYYSYSHKDQKLLEQLVSHLKPLEMQGLMKGWYDRLIEPGGDWKSQIDQHLNEADLILLLVSPSYLNSDFCVQVEVSLAMERFRMGSARVIPIILRPVNWSDAPFRVLQVLPRNAKPVTTWKSRDDAYRNIAEGIRSVVEGLTSAGSTMTR